MEPLIQYAKTKDGVSIAFWTLGEGMPLVHLANFPWSHVQAEWQNDERRHWYEQLVGKGRMLIRYDGRGTGLSDRKAIDFSLDALMLDLEAVVDKLGLVRFALLSYLVSGAAAITYAAKNPERVSRLALWCASARPTDSLTKMTEPMTRLAETDWDAFTETFAHMGMGWSAGEVARRYAAFMRDCATPEVAMEALSELLAFDVTATLPQVKAPTLVLHRRQYPWIPVEFRQRACVADTRR